MADLDFLANVKPEKGEFQKTSRGRRPGPNPMEKLLMDSVGEDAPTKIKIPAKNAKTVEAYTRKAGVKNGLSVAFQVLSLDNSVIPLNDIADQVKDGTLTGDVWAVFQGTEKTEEEKAADSKPSAPAESVADPFAGNGAAVSDPKTSKKVPAASNPK